MGIAFAASIGGLGTLIGSPTNPIAVGLLKQSIGLEISFAQWSLYGIPVVLLGVPVAAWIEKETFGVPAASRKAIRLCY